MKKLAIKLFSVVAVAIVGSSSAIDVNYCPSQGELQNYIEGGSLLKPNDQYVSNDGTKWIYSSKNTLGEDTTGYIYFLGWSSERGCIYAAGIRPLPSNAPYSFDFVLQTKNPVTN